MAITTPELLERLGLKAQRTLWRWRGFGLLPAPEKRRSPGGHGHAAYWPDETEAVGRRILELQREGYGLKAIRAALDREAADRTTHQVLEQFARGGRQRRDPADLFYASVMSAASNVFPVGTDADAQSAFRRELLQRMRDTQVFSVAMNCFAASRHPVLIFDAVEARVVENGTQAVFLETVFDVRSARPGGRPMFMLSLWWHVAEVYRSAGQTLPPVPREALVVQRGTRRAAQEGYQLAGARFVEDVSAPSAARPVKDRTAKPVHRNRKRGA